MSVLFRRDVQNIETDVALSVEKSNLNYEREVLYQVGYHTGLLRGNSRRGPPLIFYRG